ncbi:MAG TPA: hypothetical protein VFL76_03465 [Edaphocola sp.]|nr:hypothetical protein [Edaphocola sp.]
MCETSGYPFNHLPFPGEGEFTPNCEYILSLIRKATECYKSIEEIGNQIITKISNTSAFNQNDLVLFSSCFNEVEIFLNYYAKLTKIIKRCLKTGVLKHMNTSGMPNVILRENCCLLRNTSEHFDERIEELGKVEDDNLICLLYKGNIISWEFGFQRKGYWPEVRIGKERIDIFDMEKLAYRSYIKKSEESEESKKSKKRKLQIEPCTISINEVWCDILEILSLLKGNIENKILINKMGCPPIRFGGVFIYEQNTPADLLNHNI